MTRDPFLDHVEAEQQIDPATLLELDELEGCARLMLALFGICTVLSGFAALVEVLR